MNGAAPKVELGVKLATLRADALSHALADPHEPGMSGRPGIRTNPRDGVLVVVDERLERATPATPIADTMQDALDRWEEAGPLLAALYRRLSEGEAENAFKFEESECLSPLPRAYQWADGSAYVNHVALVRQARGAEIPESFWSDPLMYQGGSDGFLPPHGPIRMASADWGIDFEAEIAVVTTDVPMGIDEAEAEACIALVMLANDVSLRALIPGELAKGFGFFQSKPAGSFSPVAVTPAALGALWDGGKLHGPVHSALNGTPFGRPDAGVDMTFDFPRLIAHAARTRSLAAGTIVGSGTVSNRDADGGPGRPIAHGGAGYSCIAEQRTVETIRDGAPATPFLKDGDRIAIEFRAPDGRSVFGAIDQTVETDNNQTVEIENNQTVEIVKDH